MRALCFFTTLSSRLLCVIITLCLPLPLYPVLHHIHGRVVIRHDQLYQLMVHSRRRFSDF